MLRTSVLQVALEGSSLKIHGKVWRFFSWAEHAPPASAAVLSLLSSDASKAKWVLRMATLVGHHPSLDPPGETARLPCPPVLFSWW